MRYTNRVENSDKQKVNRDTMKIVNTEIMIFAGPSGPTARGHIRRGQRGCRSSSSTRPVPSPHAAGGDTDAPDHGNGVAPEQQGVAAVFGKASCRPRRSRLVESWRFCIWKRWKSVDSDRHR